MPAPRRRSAPLKRTPKAWAHRAPQLQQPRRRPPLTLAPITVTLSTALIDLQGVPVGVPTAGIAGIDIRGVPVGVSFGALSVPMGTALIDIGGVPFASVASVAQLLLESWPTVIRQFEAADTLE